MRTRAPGGRVPQWWGRGFGARQAWDQILLCFFLATWATATLRILLSSVSSSVTSEPTSGGRILTV